MSTIELLRPGTTFTYRGTSSTVVRVVGTTVIVRDPRGHTRRLWAERVVAECRADLRPTDSQVTSRSDATVKACLSFGIAPPKPRLTNTGRDVTSGSMHDAEDHVRQLFGELVHQRVQPDPPQSIVDLFASPDVISPQAA